MGCFRALLRYMEWGGQDLEERLSGIGGVVLVFSCLF